MSHKIKFLKGPIAERKPARVILRKTKTGVDPIFGGPTVIAKRKRKKN